MYLIPLHLLQYFKKHLNFVKKKKNLIFNCLYSMHIYLKYLNKIANSESDLIF